MRCTGATGVTSVTHRYAVILLHGGTSCRVSRSPGAPSPSCSNTTPPPGGGVFTLALMGGSCLRGGRRGSLRVCLTRLRTQCGGTFTLTLIGGNILRRGRLGSLLFTLTLPPMLVPSGACISASWTCCAFSCSVFRVMFAVAALFLECWSSLAPSMTSYRSSLCSVSLSFTASCRAMFMSPITFR